MFLNKTNAYIVLVSIIWFPNTAKATDDEVVEQFEVPSSDSAARARRRKFLQLLETGDLPKAIVARPCVYLFTCLLIKSRHITNSDTDLPY